MNMHRHFGISTTSLRDSTIRTLMDDLDRTMRLVECDIAAEEERAGIFDRADVTYPVMAIGWRRGATISRSQLHLLRRDWPRTATVTKKMRSIGWGARAEPAPLVDCRAWEARW
jgi:hypothetical protein